MVNFATLRCRTNAERIEDEQRAFAQHVARDRATRKERVRKTIRASLTADAEMRYAVSGAGVFNLHAADDRGRPSRAIWHAPDDFDRDRLHDLFDRLQTGVALTLEGYWRNRQWAGGQAFEFMAQFIAIEREPRIP